MGRRRSVWNGWGEQDGFTLVELTTALAVLVTGIFGMFTGFDSSRKLSLVSERHSTMTHIAEQEIERVEGMSYSQVQLAAAPAHSTDPANPDYYVSGGSYQYDRAGGTSEPLVIDSTPSDPAAIPLLQTETEGNGTYSVYDFVTWAQDPACAPGCVSGSPSYKRVTVAVTVASGLQPTPVYSSTTIVDPQAERQQGVGNGSTNNPVLSPSTHCTNGSGQTIECVNGLLVGNANTWYLHDWPATAGTPQPPSADHVTSPTVAFTNSTNCPQTLPPGGTLGNTSGCPIPDLMDGNPPSGGTSTSLYHYSTDVATTGYPGGTLVTPACGSCGPASPGASGTGTGGGTGSTSDCSAPQWSNSLVNTQSHMWVTAPLAAQTSLTGDGALTLFSQTAGAVPAVVSFCMEVYDIPPTNGAAGSLADILLSGSQPVALGGSAYVPPTDPASGSNWPSSASQTSFSFRFVSSSTTSVPVAAGHRIGLRVWAKANVWAPIDVLYDNPTYPASLQLNSQ
jgi:hypothetical protein